ncbi:autotransporter-associated beta strand repeat-containing protein [Luteibacter sp.]|jgi:autotransporter-associated beta strand protein|uniref:autotransporter-associated beta strand repeat-containing protein n=1 Tax=Luteibacter sp. TaxID=1886636 RepID=UPI002F3F0803
MNRIFRIVWNRTLGQLVVVSEHARSQAKGGRSSAGGASAIVAGLKRAALGVALAVCGMPFASAHTISVGYTNGGSGGLTFWYGTYHDSDEANHFEGQFQLIGPNGYEELVDFTQLVSSRPDGLEDGVNNFYASGMTGTTLTPTNQSGNPDAKTWQGVSFTGLLPGVYTYIYVPSATPSDAWNPYEPVLTNTLTITGADLNGFPMQNGSTYNQDAPELQDPNSILFNDGTFKPTQDTTTDPGQQVTVRAGGGTVDTTGGDVVFTGGVDGNGTLTKTGDGTLTLTGPSTYTGGTVVDQGTLKGDTGSLQGQIDNNGTVAFDQDGNGNFGGTIDGSGNVVKDGTGTVTFTDANHYDGATIVNDGTVALSGDGSIGTGDIVVGATGTLDTTDANHSTTGTTLAGSGSVVLGGNDLNLTDAHDTFDGTISGSGGVNVTGGTEVLTGDNTYGGGTTVMNGGTVAVDHDGALGTSGVTLDDGTLHTTGNMDMGRDILVVGTGTVDVDAGTTLGHSGAVYGSGDYVKTGSGTLDETGDLSQDGKTIVDGGVLVLGSENNSYTGNTVVNSGGTVQVSSDGNLGGASSDVELHGGTLHTTGDMDTGRDISVTLTGAVDVDSGTTLGHSGTVTGDGDFVKNGAGTLNQSGTLDQNGATIVNDGTLVLSGNNTYTGPTVLNGDGIVQVSDDANLGSASGALEFNGGTLDVTGDVNSARNIGLSSDNGNIWTDEGATFATTGGINGSGGLNKEGEGTLRIDGDANQNGGFTVADGTLVLNGNNQYSGPTTVANGATVQVNSGAALGSTSGAGLILAGGTLATTGDVDTSKTVTILGGATFDIGADTTTTAHGDISGGGDLVKAGEGTLVLDQANTFVGDTKIDDGTVQISSDTNLGAGGNVIFNGGSLHTTGNVDSSRDLVLNDDASIDVNAGTHMATGGTVSGSGALVKDGEGRLVIGGVASHTGGTIVNDGTLVLTANNTYTGGNTINGGTLQVQNDANLGDASNGIDFEGGSLHTTGSFTTARDLSLTGSGTIATDVGTTVVATGNVAGASGLVKEGKGTLDISGALSQGGGTTVNTGTLILGGNNTYTGGTTINGGTLQVSSDENLGDASNDIAIDGGNLSVTKTMSTDRDILIGSHGASITTADGVTLNEKGDMSGAGGLTKLGGGTLVVYGNNTFTGGTLIQGGVIRINSGSSLGTGQILLRGGTLQSDASLGTGQEVIISGDSGVNVAVGTTTVLSGNLMAAEGNGCFVKSGKGYLSLTGNSSLASGTCVQDGVLSANGNLASSFVQVDSIGTLRGTGLITGPVNVEGRLAAGNSPGTLTVAGTVTMQAGSTMQVDIDGLGTGNGAGNYSRVLVVGEGNRFVASGTLAPTLRGITGDASNTYTPALGDTYRIVTAEGGVEGRFTTLEQPTDGLAANTRFLAFYGANAGHSIDLRVAPVSYAELLGAHAKRNGLSAAGALDDAVTALDAGNATAAQNGLLYAVSSLRADGVTTMVNSLSGEVHADQAAAARTAGLGMQRDVSDHLGTDKSADVAHNVWANVTRDGNRSIADGQGSGFETGTDRTTAGVDLYTADGTVIGVAGTHHDTNVIAHGGSGSIRGNSGIVYAQQAMGSFVLDGMAAYGTTDWTTRRADPMGGSQLETRTSGKDSMASATLRMPMQMAGGSRIEPYASVVWQKVERDAVSEHGSVAALSVDALSEKGTRVLAGVTMGSKAADPLASTLTWRAGIAVGADTGDLLDPTVHDTLAGQRFDTAAPGVGRGFVQVNANGTMRLGKSTYLYGGLTAEEGSSRSAYGVTAGVRVAF